MGLSTTLRRRFGDVLRMGDHGKGEQEQRQRHAVNKNRFIVIMMVSLHLLWLGAGFSLLPIMIYYYSNINKVLRKY